MGSNIHRTRPAAHSGMRVRVIAAAIAGCLAHGAAYANPQGGVVTNGQATFNTQGNVFTITNTPGTIINWQNFSINANETTRFLQQSASSAVLNRILGQDPSQILGALQSNGKVFLINPNGILFGRGARVDTNGLVASTLDIGNQDFLSGKMKFAAGANAGSVENRGTISTPSGGQVYLIAPSVTNSGIITSPQGEVVLAAGRSVQLVDSGDPDLHVVVSAPQDRALNLGQIIARSGKVGIYGALIDQNGTVNADSAVVGKNGKIVFKASGDTILGDGSRTSATGAGSGGTVHVLGERVGLAGNAQVDASGRAGGGTVLVGGDYHGENVAIQNAKRTYVNGDAQIRADATGNGNGGRVIVWSDEITRDYGSISARGGAQGGDGGFVESSGKETLDHRAKVDVSAPKGNGGTLLLDPATITLVGGTGEGAASPDGVTTFQGSATPGTVNFADSDLTSAGVSNIYQSELEGLAPGTNIILEASDYITATGTFSNLVTLPTNSNLTMRTRNASTDGTGTIGIDLVSSVDSSNLEFRTQGTGTITLQTGTGASPQAADINVGKLTTAGGSIDVNASGNVVLRGAITTPTAGNGGNISLVSGGYMTLGGATIDARGTSGANGNVTLKSGGPISMQTGDTIYGDQLTMVASGGISGTSSFDAMSTQVNSLNATNAGSGSITISNSGSDLSIFDPGSIGYGVKNLSNGDSISISTGAGEMLNVNALISANNGPISLSGDGSINLAADVSGGVSGNVSLFSNSGAVLGTGIVNGNRLSAQAADGIALSTQVSNLSASNSGGANPISFTNAGTLHLQNFQQNGSGGISVDNTGPLFVDFCDCSFFGGTGGINLTTDSALTVNGMIGSGAGDLAFKAGTGTGDTLTINTNIASSGNVILTAGDAISLANGDTISANQLQMAAGGGIYGTASTDPMTTQVAFLNASNSGSGPIYISNSGANLSIADIGSVGYGVKSTAAGSTIDISTGTGEALNLSAPVSANGGTINLNGAGGVNLFASTAPEISSNGGAINLSSSDTDAMISTAAGTQINSGGGTISLQADKMQLLGGINATSSGIVALAPNSGVGIDLGAGSTDLNSTLELSNSELGGITAGTVAIGNSSSGSIDVKSTLTSGFPAMSLTAGGFITQQPGALLGGALSFKLTAVSVNLPEANPTGVIAGSASGGDFLYRSANGIAVSNVDGQSGLYVPGNVKLVSDSANGINQSAPIIAGGLALQSAGPVVLTDSGNAFIALAADLSAAASGSGNLQVFNAYDFPLDSVFGINGITTNNSGIDISAPSTNLITVNQPVNAGNGAVTLQAGNIALAGAAIDGGTINLTATQAGTGAIVTSGGVRIGDTAATNTTDVKLEADNLSFLQGIPTINAGHSITYANFTDNGSISTSPLVNAIWNAPYFVIGSDDVASANTTADITVDGALNQAGKSIVFLAGGNISQTAGITASSLAIRSGTNTGSASSVQLNAGNAVDNIAASTNGGMFSFNDTTALNISSITDGTHTATGIVSGNGNIGVTAAGDLTVSSPVDGGTGSVSLFSSNGKVNGTGLVSANSLDVQAADGIVLSTQVANLSASNAGGANPISFANTGMLHLQNFQQNGSGGILIDNTGPLFVDFCDCSFFGGTGGINLTTDSALTVNGVIGSDTGDLTLKAGTGAGNTLTINTNIASSGNVILKAGDAISLANGDTISANQLQMAAGGGIYGTASTDPMTTQVAFLNASNSGSGPIYISNSGSNLSIADIGSVGYGVKSTAAGSMIDISTGTGEALNLSAPVSASAGTINLNGAGGINLSASTAPEISSNSGDINLTASDTGAMISTPAGTQINSGGGTISLQADKMQLLGGINATSSGIVALAPNSGVGIDLGAGSTDLNSTLELSNSELGGITAGIVKIGNSGSGSIDVKSTLTSGFPAMSLTTTGSITQQPGALLGGALSLDLKGSSVTLTEANPTGVIAGSATSGSFQYHSSNGIAVSAVDGQQGISAPAGVALVSDSASGINQSAPIVTSGLALQSAGPVMLTDSSNQIGMLAANLGGTGNLSVFSSNALTLNSVLGINGITAQNGNIDLSVMPSGSIIPLQGIDAGSGSVNLSAGNIALGSGATIDGRNIALNTLQSGGIISTTGAGVRIGDAAATNTSDVKFEADNVDFSQGAPTINAGHSITYASFTDDGSISTSPLINAIWNAPYFVIGSDDVASTNTTGDITVDGALNQAGKSIVFLAGGNISQTAGITASSLAIRSGTNTGSASSVQLNAGNAVDNIAASTNGGMFSFNDTTALNISSITDGTHTVTGIVSGNGNIGVTAASGDLTVSSPVDGGTGSVSLFSSSGKVNGTGLVSANSLDVQAADGIALSTQVSNLSASNAGGANPISFANTGMLHLQNFQQNGSGGMSVDNIGPLFVDSGSLLSSGTGAINLTAHSPLTVDGSVSSTSGNITLFAGATGTYGAGDTLTINGQVSTGGNITLKAGDAIVFGASSTVSAGGTLSQSANLNLPSLATCISAPSTANCSLVLPSLSVCTAAPTTAGCSVVLPTLATCEASPTTAGCSAVLPTLTTCVGAPTTAGCSVVLPTLATCEASPTTAGCSAVLPTLATCVSSPATAGCGAVLPTLATCVSSPATAGCSVVLPTTGQCQADPTLAGCKSASNESSTPVIQSLVTLMNHSTTIPDNSVSSDTSNGTPDDDGKKKETGDHTGGSSKDSGAKHNEHTEKMYCN